MPLLLRRGLFSVRAVGVFGFPLPLREPPLRFSSRFAVRYQGQRSRRKQTTPVFFNEVIWIIYFVFKGIFFVVRVTLISPKEFRFSYGVFRKKRSARQLFSPGRLTPFFRSVVFGTHFHSFGTVSGSPCFQGIPKRMLKCCSERVANQCTHSLTTPSGGGTFHRHCQLVK